MSPAFLGLHEYGMDADRDNSSEALATVFMGSVDLDCIQQGG